MKKQLTFISAACFAVLLFSCNSSRTSETGKDTTAEDSLHITTPVSASVNPGDETEAALPSPLRIATLFKKAGLHFNESALNKLENISKYNSGLYKQSLNLGIYSSDMAYCILNKQYSKAKDYLRNCKALGSEIGISSAFEANDLAKRFERNLGSEDSLISIVSELQLQTDIVLEKNRQNYVSSLIFTGAWVEAMHTAGLLYDKEEQVSTAILEQLNLLHLIVAVLDRQKDMEKNIPALINELKSIESDFLSLQGINGKNTDEIDLSSVKVSSAQLEPIFKKIGGLRSNIING